MTASSASFDSKPLAHADRLNVLVADDTPMFRQLVRRVLSSAGFAPAREAAGGRAAFRDICLDPPDLLIAERAMPDGDGVALVRRIRCDVDSPNPLLPVIMLSAALSVEQLAAARDAGVDEFVAKPFAPAALLARIVALVEKPRDFVLAPGYVGPSRRRRTAPHDGTRRGPGEAASRILPAPELLRRRMADDSDGRQKTVQDGIAALRALQPAWADAALTDLETLARAARDEAPGSTAAARLCAGLDRLAVRLQRAGAATPARTLSLLRSLVAESAATATPAVIDVHLDALIDLVAQHRRAPSPTLFAPLADDLARLVTRQRQRPGTAPPAPAPPAPSAVAS